jgi:hypothetical protein
MALLMLENSHSLVQVPRRHTKILSHLLPPASRPSPASLGASPPLVQDQGMGSQFHLGEGARQQPRVSVDHKTKDERDSLLFLQELRNKTQLPSAHSEAAGLPSPGLFHGARRTCEPGLHSAPKDPDTSSFKSLPKQGHIPSKTAHTLTSFPIHRHSPHFTDEETGLQEAKDCAQVTWGPELWPLRSWVVLLSILCIYLFLELRLEPQSLAVSMHALPHALHPKPLPFIFGSTGV